MKKKIIGIFIVMLLITPITIASIEEQKDEICRTETILFSQPILREKGDYITVDVTESTSSSIGGDKPKLPVITKTFTFPFNNHITNIDISFSTINKEVLSKPIIPAPEPQVLSSSYSSKNVVMNKATEIYTEFDIYPEQRCNYRIGAGLKDGLRVKFLTIHLYPIQYIPKDNVIHYSDSATIDITFSPSKNPISFPDEYDLLIITPIEFSDELQTLVDYKNDNEISTVMVTLDDIPKKGVDQQEDIKFFIKNSIETWGITYVLIIGSGVNGIEKFPVRYVYCSPYTLEPNFASDLYYADIFDGNGEFSSWNYDNDSRFVEYHIDTTAVDVYPDVYLGRLACNDKKEVSTVVDKIIHFSEKNRIFRW